MSDADPYGQSPYQVRFDWGLEGARTIGRGADVVVVVDVLSFSTATIAAVEAGIEVVPSGPSDSEELARQRGAAVAAARGSGPSLSPRSLIDGLGTGARIVLPSPNGSTICASIAGGRSLVVAGAIRNTRAVADWALVQQDKKQDRLIVAVVGAGERRPEAASLRFAVEDLLGAGAIIDALANLGIDDCSPEAAAAAAAFSGLKNATRPLVVGSASGRELIAKGFGEDVEFAASIDQSTTVPVLGEFGFRAER